METKEYRKKNNWYRLKERIKHPWPFYKRVGGISAVVIRANGKKENLGRISDTYIKRKGWSVGSK
jgi:hypothetical protein